LVSQRMCRPCRASRLEPFIPSVSTLG
jgi:hypothetical protein